MSRSDVISLAAEGMTVVLCGIGRQFARQRQLELLREPSSRGAPFRKRTFIALRQVRATDECAVVEQRTVERCVGAGTPGKSVEIEPDLPSARVRSTEISLDESARRHVEQHRPPAKREDSNGLGDPVAHSRKRAKVEFGFRNPTLETLVQRARDVADDLRSHAEPDCLELGYRINSREKLAG